MLYYVYTYIILSMNKSYLLHLLPKLLYIVFLIKI